MVKVAILGGTGLTRLEEFKVLRREVVYTPYGEPSGPLTYGMLAGCEAVFLARHGYGHTIPPHQINYRANLWALQSIGITAVVAFASVGAINSLMKPGSLAVPQQIVDYTHGRPHTYFEEGRVVHIDFSEPYDLKLRGAILQAGKTAGLDIYDGGVYAATQGPRLETAAEINRFEKDGCDMVGMTAMPETALARELDLRYATCALVTNWAAGRTPSGESIHDAIRENLRVGVRQAYSLLGALLPNLSRHFNEPMDSAESPEDD